MELQTAHTINIQQKKHLQLAVDNLNQQVALLIKEKQQLLQKNAKIIEE